MPNSMDSPNKNSFQLVEEWVEKYADYLSNWANHKIGIKEDAEDLVQETFMAALNKADAFEGKSSPKTWLVSILNHKIIDYYRAKGKNKTISFDKEEMSFEATDGFFDANENWKAGLFFSWGTEVHLLDDPEFILIFQKCIEDVPDRWRTILQSKFMSQKNADWICKEFSVSPSNYWQIIHRSKLLIKKCLELYWFGNNKV